MAQTRGVLFVCTANTCRSPIAEAIFAHLIREKGLTDKWFTDSAGIDAWHGKEVNQRAQNVLNKHNITFSHRARQVKREDFDRFDYILCMDEWHLEEFNRFKPMRSKAVVDLLGDYHSNGPTIIDDPFFDETEESYRITYDKCWNACNAFIERLH